MRTTLICPKCDSQKIGHFEHLCDRSNVAGSARTLSSGVEKTRGIKFFPKVHSADVEAFVCTECGYFEEYVKKSEAVQWEQLDNFTWCKPQPAVKLASR